MTPAEKVLLIRVLKESVNTRKDIVEYDRRHPGVHEKVDVDAFKREIGTMGTLLKSIVDGSFS
jgi:hypothetical protein